jgi:hypothetical protein
VQPDGRMRQGGKARPALIAVVPDKTTVVVWDLWHAEVTHTFGHEREVCAIPSAHKNAHSAGSGAICARRQWAA